MKTSKANSAVALLSALILSAPIASATQNPEPQSSSRTSVAASGAIDFTKAAEATINRVVSIKSYATPKQTRMQSFDDPFFEFFFGPNFGNSQRQQQQKNQKKSEPQPLGLGSGVIVSEDGYIVTNNHVVENAEKLEVTMNDNKTYNATIIGTDSNTDLALLKIDASNLSYITYGDSDKLKVGEWVLAVGNPFGLTSTVTAGIVSAKARNVSSVTHSQQVGIESFIQTDAVVNQGNSGGALVNTKGELVGINTLIYSRTGDYSGYAFAIPTSIVKKVISDLKQYGTVQRAMLGITFTQLTPELCKEKDIKITEGIYVNDVQDQSAAKEAGLEKEDVITEIGNTQVRNTAELQEAISQYSPGDKAVIKYYRDGKQKSTTVTFKNSQGNTKITKESDFTALGCTFSKLPQKTKDTLHITSGVVVGGVTDGKFKDAGITNGFIIQEINEQKVNSQSDVESIYNSIMRDSSQDKVMYIKGLLPTGKRAYLAVPLEDEE